MTTKRRPDRGDIETNAAILASLDDGVLNMTAVITKANLCYGAARPRLVTLASRGLVSIYVGSSGSRRTLKFALTNSGRQVLGTWQLIEPQLRSRAPDRRRA